MALTKITPEIVAVNAIQGTLIADNAITAVHIATNAVSGTLIADNAVTATHIAQNVITVTQLADDAVEADKIADGVITTNHLNKAMISSQTEVTAASGDYVLIGDTSDSNNLKKALVSDFGNDLDAAVTINESGAAVDFRVEGDTEQNLFFVDGSADKIGIGTASPLSHLTFESDHWNTGTEDGPSIRWNNGITTADSVIQNFEDANVAPFLIGMNSYIASGGSYAPFNSSYASSFIYQGATGNILFGNASSGTPTAKMTIAANGNLTYDSLSYDASADQMTINNGLYLTSGYIRSGAADMRLGTASQGVQFTIDDTTGHTSIGTTAVQARLNVQQSGANSWIGHFMNSEASTPYGLKVEYTGGSPNSSSNYWFFYAEDTTEAKAKLRSNGYFYLAGTAYGSDRELKENIVDTPDSLAKLKQIKVRDFNLKGQSEKHTGVIAQEIETLFPDLLGEEVISKEDAEVEKKIKTVEYNGLIGILIKSVQELEARLAALE